MKEHSFVIYKEMLCFCYSSKGLLIVDGSFAKLQSCLLIDFLREFYMVNCLFIV